MNRKTRVANTEELYEKLLDSYLLRVRQYERNPKLNIDRERYSQEEAKILARDIVEEKLYTSLQMKNNFGRKKEQQKR